VREPPQGLCLQSGERWVPRPTGEETPVRRGPGRETIFTEERLADIIEKLRTSPNFP